MSQDRAGNKTLSWVSSCSVGDQNMLTVVTSQRIRYQTKLNWKHFVEMINKPELWYYCHIIKEQKCTQRHTNIVNCHKSVVKTVQVNKTIIFKAWQHQQILLSSSGPDQFQVNSRCLSEYLNPEQGGTLKSFMTLDLKCYRMVLFQYIMYKKNHINHTSCSSYCSAYT